MKTILSLILLSFFLQFYAQSQTVVTTYKKTVTTNGKNKNTDVTDWVNSLVTTGSKLNLKIDSLNYQLTTAKSIYQLVLKTSILNKKSLDSLTIDDNKLKLKYDSLYKATRPIVTPPSPPVVSKILKVDYLKSFQAKGDNDYFVVTSNTTWKIVSYPSWVKIDILSGTGNKNVTVTAGVNPDTIQRSGLIKLSGTGARDTSLRITQDGTRPFVLLISKGELKLPSVAGFITFEFSSNIAWYVSTKDTWYTISPITKPSGEIVTITFGSNIGLTKEGKITFTGINGIVQDVLVYQSGSTML
jgi:hypothetical protein